MNSHIISRLAKPAKKNKPAANHPWRKTSPDWLRRNDTHVPLSSPLVGCVHSRRGKAPC